ncbi:probable small intestine urate exporter [Battus philenor]|uniref:probable small intestine urate exporter n=1 Tax=Battus philenor TaxID=42288 RepID=UPI0035D0A808
MILKSKPFWALCILNFGYAWIIISLCIHGPLYYTLVLKYTLYEASALTALPFLLRLVIGTIVIQIFFWYKQNDKIKRVKHIRKYFIFVSHVIPGVLVSSLWLFPAIPGPTILTLAVALTAAGMDLTFDICYNSIHVWKNIWCFHATILLLSGIAFLIWGQTVVQPWNSIKNRPRRKINLTNIRPSVMSNITEVEENDSVCQTILPQSKKSFLTQIC